MTAFCPICNPDPNVGVREELFQPCHPECLAKVELPTEEDFREAIEQGAREAELVAANEGSQPISGMRFR